MSCVRHFMRSPIADLLASRLYPESKKSSDKPKSMLSSWVQVVDRPLETYAIEDVIVKTEMEMQAFKISSIMAPNYYAEALWIMALQCNRVCNK